jgi:tetratricopeptide (TPR) repeat protein
MTKVRITSCFFALLFICIFLCISGISEETIKADANTHNASDVLKRADEVALLAQGTVDQTSRTVELIKNLAYFLSIIFTGVAIVLGYYGYNTQKGFKDYMDEQKKELERYRVEMNEITDRKNEIQKEVQETKAIKQELDSLKNSVKKDFDDIKRALILMGMGDGLFREGKRDLAINAYEKARSLLPDDADINFRLGSAYSDAGRFDDAIKILEKAASSRQNFPEACMALGLAIRRRADRLSLREEERKAQYKLAEYHLKKAVELNPYYEDGQGTLGGFYRRQGQNKEALSCYRNAFTIDPNSSYALGNIASLTWALKGPKEARIHFERLEELALERIKTGKELIFWPMYDLALARLAMGSEGKKEEAMKDYETAIKNTPEIEILQSVLDNLRFLKKSQNYMDGLDEVITRMEEEIKKRS